MFLLENVMAIAIWLLVGVVAVNFVFLCFVFYRRFWRTRYFAAKDAARERYLPVVEDFIEERLTPEQTVSLLRQGETEAERDAIRDLLLDRIRPKTARRVTDVLLELDYVAKLARQAFGRSRAKRLIALAKQGRATITEPKPAHGVLDPIRRLRAFSVPRALAVDGLTRLSPEAAAVFVSEALTDPSTEVRRVAIASLGLHPSAIPLLLEELRRAIEEGNDLSLRATKAALVRFRLDEVDHFLPMLRHPNRRLRFFVVDAIREITSRAAKKLILNKNDFSLAMYEIFLEQISRDEFADVRARSASVIRHFHDDRAEAALRRLLKDENEFVRLHALRAAADVQYSGLVPSIVEGLGDPKWRVREAASKALSHFGRQGSNEMYRAFVATRDQYASEQLADEMQRGGFTQDLVAVLASPAEEARLSQSVCEKLVLLGKTSLLSNAIASEKVSIEARLALMDMLMEAPSEHFYRVLERLATHDRGELGNRARLYMKAFDEAAGATAASSGG